MKHRISSERDFQTLYRRGQRIATPTILVYMLPSPSGLFEYAIVVPNSVIPLATKRNAVRRRIRSILETHIQDTKEKQILISVQKDASRLSFSALKEELSPILARIGKSSQ